MPEDDQDKLEESAEDQWRQRARRLASARRLPLLVGSLWLVSLTIYLVPAPEGVFESEMSQAQLAARSVMLISTVISASAMFAFYVWAKKSAIPAVLCTFAVYALLVAGNLVERSWSSARTWTSLLLPLLVTAALVRGLSGGLQVLTEDVAAAALRCESCGEDTPAGQHCACCGEPLASSQASMTKPVPSLRELLIVFVICMLLPVVDVPLSMLDESETLGLLSEGVFAVVVCWLAWKERAALAALFRRRLPRVGEVALTAAVVVAYTFLLPYFAWMESQGFEYERLVESTEALELSLLALILCVIVPVLEETAFRGYTLYQLDRVMSSRDALIVQAVLFAVVHFSVASLPSHFLIGMGLGWLRRRTGSLYPSMLAHGGINAIALAWQAYRL